MDITQLTNDFLESTRVKHNQLLDLMDKYVLPDYPMESSNLRIVKDFKNELRNYFSSSNVNVVGWEWLQDIQYPPIFPKTPAFLKLNFY